MPFHAYNIKAAEQKITAMMANAASKITVTERMTGAIQVAIALMEDNHRAVALLYPELVEEVNNWLIAAAADLEEAHDIGAVDNTHIQPYYDALKHTYNLVRTYTPEDDCDSHFTAGSERCIITSDGGFVEDATGVRHGSLVAWANNNAIPFETIIAHIHDAREEPLSCGCIALCEGHCEQHSGW